MKVTIQQIVDSVEPFREIQTLSYTPRTALNIYKLGKEIDKELNGYREVAKKIYEKFEIPMTEQGFELGKITDEKRLELFGELDELASSEVELKDLKISLDELGASNNNVSPVTIGRLEWMLDIPEEPIVGEPKPKKDKTKTGK